MKLGIATIPVARPAFQVLQKSEKNSSRRAELDDLHPNLLHDVQICHGPQILSCFDLKVQLDPSKWLGVPRNTKGQSHTPSCQAMKYDSANGGLFSSLDLEPLASPRG